MRRFSIALVVAASLVAATPAGAAQELTYRYGPVQVDGFEVDQGTALSNVPKPFVDGYVTGMEVEVVDAAGQPISPKRLMLHHVVFLNLGQAGKFDHRDRTCSIFTGLDNQTKLPALADRFYAAGEERNKLRLPPGYGYPVKGDDYWIVTWMLMNHRATPDRAYIQYKVTYESERPLTPAYMIWLDVENCLADPVYDVPGGGTAGSTHSRSITWNAREPGRIVAGGGHVHGGGRSIALSQPGCGGREVFSSRPLYGLPSHDFYNVKPVLHEPGPIDMSGFMAPTGIPLARGQPLRITASYDNARPHTRVMGIMGLYFSPDAGVTDGCAPLPPLETHAASVPGRAEPPSFTVPLARKPKGRIKRLGRKTTIDVGDFYYERQRVRVSPGSVLRWRFDGTFLHDVTVANGPLGFSSPHLDDARSPPREAPGARQLQALLQPAPDPHDRSRDGRAQAEAALAPGASNRAPLLGGLPIVAPCHR